MNATIARIRSAALGALALALTACSTAEVTADVALAPDPQRRPATIYVAPFDLPDAAMRSESLMAGLPLHAAREQSRARALADDLEQDVARELRKRGLAVLILAQGEAPAGPGWLVQGTILRMDEGDRLRRAVIGFGSGQTDLQVAVAIDDLKTGAPPAPLYRMQTDAQSGESPGAVVTLNPYAGAAKFVLAGHDLAHNVGKTASQIANRVVAHLNEAGQAARRDEPTRPTMLTSQ